MFQPAHDGALPAGYALEAAAEWQVINATQRSTRLSHEALVGMKCGSAESGGSPVPGMINISGQYQQNGISLFSSGHKWCEGQGLRNSKVHLQHR